MSLKNQEKPKVVIFVAPSGWGKSGIAKGFEEKDFTPQKSLIEYSPLKIKYNQEKSRYYLANRLPRKKDENSSIWIDLEDLDNFDLQDEAQRSRLQDYINQSLYSIDKINWDNVLKSDKAMYTWLLPEEYIKELKKSDCYTNVDTLDGQRGYAYQKDQGDLFVEVSADTLEVNYDTLIDGGFDVSVVLATAPLDMLIGHLNWRGDSKTQVESRVGYNQKFLEGVRNPETNFGKVLSKIKNEGRLIKIHTDRNFYNGPIAEHRDKHYRFVASDTPLNPELIIKPVNQALGQIDPMEAHLEYIFNCIRSCKTGEIVPEAESNFQLTDRGYDKIFIAFTFAVLRSDIFDLKREIREIKEGRPH